jgi:hypothetical protein
MLAGNCVWHDGPQLAQVLRVRNASLSDFPDDGLDDGCRTKNERAGSAMDRMPPRYAFRLEDLRAWHVVEAECGSCRHRAVIDHASLTHGRSGSMRLADLETRLRCCRCGGHSLTVSLRPRD